MVLNLKAVVGTLGVLLTFLGVSLLIPLGIALAYGESAAMSFAITSAVSLAIGGAAWYRWGRELDQLRVREGFAIVALAWFVMSLGGALPFVLSGTLTSYTDAFFETMSGFTTTGATILGGAATPAIEDLPQSLLFWRSLAHWLGGMGIIVLTLAILPILGVGGMQLFKAEVPGPSADKLTPRVRETAKRLWMIYVGFTVLQVLLLLPAMDLFDSVNHAFATMATGGFSTKNASIGHFGSAYVDWVVTVFMFLAGVSFVLHYRLLRGEGLKVLRNSELMTYTAIIVVASLVVSFMTWNPGSGYSGYETIGQALRHGTFQVTAIVTTTGFATADYEVWPPLAITVIFALFFVGGMAGSTGGGVKVVRQLLLLKNTMLELQRLIHPNAVLPLRLDGRVVPADAMRNVLSFIFLYFALIVFGTIVLAGFGLDLESALGAALSSVGNVGPAFGSLGPTDTYAGLPAAAKWFLSFLMMAGRLEIFTVMILFAPSFWRR